MSRKSKKLYHFGSRATNVKHSQMRMECSKLNSHLFHNLHVINSPSFNCGYNVENNKHFLLDCPLYIIQRQKMFQQLQNFIDINELNIEILLYGSNDYDYITNRNIFEIVHDFINGCDRL